VTHDRIHVAAVLAAVTLAGLAATTVWVAMSGSRRAAGTALVMSVVAVAAAIAVVVLLRAALGDLRQLAVVLDAPSTTNVEALPSDLRDATAPVLARAQRLDAETVRDPATGVLPHREADHRLLAEVDRVRRHGGAVAILLLAVDGIVDLRRDHGEPAAHELLRGVAAVLESTARPSDIIGRMGDGFVVILPHAEPAGAVLAAERFAQASRATTFVAAGGPSHVTLSVGVAGFPGETSSPGDLLVAARDGMERARRAGGDRVVRARG